MAVWRAAGWGHDECRRIGGFGRVGPGGSTPVLQDEWTPIGAVLRSSTSLRSSKKQTTQTHAEAATRKTQQRLHSLKAKAFALTD